MFDKENCSLEMQSSTNAFANEMLNGILLFHQENNQYVRGP